MRALTVLCLSLMIATCGQKGPLYLPEDSARASSLAVAPVIAAPETSREISSQGTSPVASARSHV